MLVVDLYFDIVTTQFRPPVFYWHYMFWLYACRVFVYVDKGIVRENHRRRRRVFFISLLREFAGKCSSIYYITILFHVAFEVACSSLLNENPYFKSRYL